MSKKIICIIPARENSKRIKKKNLKIFLNKPLVYWTLKFSTKLKNVNKIIFTSDSNVVLSVAKPFKKIKKLLRPKKLANDKTLMKDVLLNALSKKDKKNYAGILLLQPTTPFRNLKKFNRYLKNFKNKIGNYYSVSFKHKTNHKCYLEKKLFFFKKGKVCYQTGSLILISMKSFLKKKTLSINNSFPIVSDIQHENFDIDNIEDFNRAQKILKKKLTKPFR